MTRVICDNGGERGIRTLGTRERTTVFETAPFDHSGISPQSQKSCGTGRAETNLIVPLWQAVPEGPAVFFGTHIYKVYAHTFWGCQIGHKPLTSAGFQVYCRLLEALWGFRVFLMRSSRRL